MNFSRDHLAPWNNAAHLHGELATCHILQGHTELEGVHKHVSEFRICMVVWLIKSASDKFFMLSKMNIAV